jgi:hypothetical protein
VPDTLCATQPCAVCLACVPDRPKATTRFSVLGLKPQEGGVFAQDESWPDAVDNGDRHTGTVQAASDGPDHDPTAWSLVKGEL